MAEVLVVGAGPVGLTLACELARHGVRCRIIDKAPKPSAYCRAIGVTPRTLEVWDDMGIAREMIGAGLWITGMRSILPGRPPVDALLDDATLPYGGLGLPQYETERVLARHLDRAGLAVERGTALAGLHQDAEAVTVRLVREDGASEQTAYRHVIGCDGAHSAVRHALGIAFAGEAMPMTFMLGDVHIAWDLPYGMTLRAVHPREDGPPDLFVAVPLPERGRYRVSMAAPESLSARGGSGHGIQAELPGPDLADLQAVADRLLPERPVLSDLRWSSLFRISMRLAERYGEGRVFLAGDAAHIHPPTGGQGMNTGIQDAYNLAWKLALVLRGASPDALLDSYGAERRPVGEEVVARTLAASMRFGREPGGRIDRSADTQLGITYRGGDWVRDDGGGADGPVAGDRAPDATGLRQRGIGVPLRLHEVLRGTEHILLARVTAGDELAALSDFALEAGRRLDRRLRVVALGAAPAGDQPGVTLLEDREGRFAAAYGSARRDVLVRPDGHLGWSGPSWRDPGLVAHLGRLFPRGAIA
ncbi:FAD-dependent monooxygenase [Roseomonas sp. OT10]|uniref:FAD-dependent monooxygenase n=1 Tax=Roseomonas cutis TaxID=2897332 RepID=UPI001E2E039C|nr:FAD-dependent monooxygenase [Roseomonas sp. OT10]UFN51002.1 FAD-dependent monooxygenase [Roseomonas sp. OT10]